MSDFFKSNLIYLREKRGENQSKTASELGLSRSTYANYEVGANQPKAEGIFKILVHFGVSFEELMSVDLAKGAIRSKNSDKKNKNVGAIDGVNQGANSTKTTQESVVKPELEYQNTYPIDHKNNVYDFESKAAAGEALFLLESDRMMVEPNLYLPHLGVGIHVRFPISGDSMHSTIKDSDKAVATLVSDLSEIRQGHIYGILDKHDGLVCKRVYIENKTTLELVSDNEVYKPYKRHLKDIISLFRVREVHSTDLRPYYDDIRKEMREIRSEMADLKRAIGK